MTGENKNDTPVLTVKQEIWRRNKLNGIKTQSQSERKTNQIWTVNAIKRRIILFSRRTWQMKSEYILQHRFQFFFESKKSSYFTQQSDELKEQLLNEVKCSVCIRFICIHVKHAWNLVGSLSPVRVLRQSIDRWKLLRRKSIVQANICCSMQRFSQNEIKRQCHG